MRKTGYFLRTILVFIIVLLVQAAGVIVSTLVSALLGGESIQITSLFQSVLDRTNDPTTQLYSLLFYSIIAIIIFGIWYNGRFIAPFKGMKRNYQSGFSLLTILTLVITAFGMQFVGESIVNIISRIAPAIASSYNETISTIGIGSSYSPIMLAYVVVLGPIAEELIFRGLIYRFSRLAFPFWAANVWQAALFAIFHMNLVQGIYAFVLGLVFGYIAHRGHGIRYSVFAHIATNALGCFAAFFFGTLCGSFTGLSLLIGVILILFPLFVFSVEFHPLHKTRPAGVDPTMNTRL